MNCMFFCNILYRISVLQNNELWFMYTFCDRMAMTKIMDARKSVSEIVMLTRNHLNVDSNHFKPESSVEITDQELSIFQSSTQLIPQTHCAHTSFSRHLSTRCDPLTQAPGQYCTRSGTGGSNATAAAPLAWRRCSGLAMLSPSLICRPFACVRVVGCFPTRSTTKRQPE